MNNLELAVLCSAMTFLRLRRPNAVAMLGSLCEKLGELTKHQQEKVGSLHLKRVVRRRIKIKKMGKKRGEKLLLKENNVKRPICVISK